VQNGTVSPTKTSIGPIHEEVKSYDAFFCPVTTKINTSTPYACC